MKHTHPISIIEDFLRYFLFAAIPLIGGVSIIPEMQGKGFGKIIMNTLQNYIKAKHIFVLVNNKNNTGFYFNLGYKPYGRFITQGI